jgi:hypothetical protein
MSDEVRELADAVLHEGYLLYPYTDAALKNLHRYPFGTLYPEEFCRTQDAGDGCFARLECIAVGAAEARVSVEARFLHMLHSGGEVRDACVPELALGALANEGCRRAFEFDRLCALVEISAVEVQSRVWKVIVELRNSTRLAPDEAATRDQALRHALASAHILVRIESGEFVSAIDPPENLRAPVEACRSIGVWPVLVGTPGTRDTLLAAPIILYDYPQLAPESPGDFFDGTEIDELLTLRVLTLTDEEKRAMSQGDTRARALLERTEASGLARLGELHGRLRARPTLRPGARVRLHPKGRADIMDLALTGKAATVQAVERDFEGRTYVAVSVDEDPGKDLGAYGHRFFFGPEEVELL